jgi:hypothetical protein
MPVAVSVVSPHRTTSDTILAFHEPPAAVTAPVTYAGKIAGRITRRHHNDRLTPRFCAARCSSTGNAVVPTMTLNKIYHCVPRIISGLSQISGFA